jgi:uncharacterized protein (TIGR00106 family)
LTEAESVTRAERGGRKGDFPNGDGLRAFSGATFTTLPIDGASMTVVALLSVAPVTEESMADKVANAVEALDGFDVAYETNPMGTVIEADSTDELFAAAQAAHDAVDGDRVSTFLKIDDKRTSDQPAAEKVDAVEEVLGRPARSDSE